ncbi:MAG: hypothetical protein PHU03_04500 [Syntrophales bacterium]|nr:hypothetical protein [Syntrophales bacterium]
MNDDQFRKLLDDYGYSWQGYRKVRKGVIKRLVRHMQQLGARNAEHYLEKIKSEPEIRLESKRLMTVSVSRFFRDRPLWEYLKKKLIPGIVSRNPSLVTVWSAGCALGQEVYSFKILWRIMEEESGPLPPLSLMATDINREYLAVAASGVYGDHVSKEIPENWLERFFRFDQGRYCISEDLKRNISWRLHDLTGALLTGESHHIIFMRNNLLTYYKDEFHESAVNRIAGALKEGGYLIIGSGEKMTVDDRKLRMVEDYPGIFQRHYNV